MSVNLDKLPQAVEALVRLGARRVILFGSAAECPEKANDIDLAVEGIPDSRILDADVELMKILECPFDLVSRDMSPRFYDIVRDYGRVLHG
ncbi:MAG: hypothetical protein A3K19_07720 [Lentisphaerae bacterium RIFOXYB12_FULL_65_16]|nr:MAG: hypothetical protein A3K18_07425 [Lentisphaerae bacterium RIFOXYA12_64_32]OGV87536.1 MAG: hypothetical protein A3K19_07720 [Lentisphaerae bacterium RIFOXYB12_FULL_65_16]